MRRRRHYREVEVDNHDRWMISYADFITLLFAFFVVMYAISSVNEGKYRILSESLGDAFKNEQQTDAAISEVDGVGGQDAILEGAPSLMEIPASDIKTHLNTVVSEEQLVDEETLRERRMLRDLAGRLEQAMAPYINDELINVKREKDWLEIEIKSSMLFESGSAELFDNAVPLLSDIASQVSHLPNPLHVEGFTDNVPIDTLEFPSNWELSAARAASVVHLFSEMRINPDRMAAIGYGEYHPVADNDTADGRNQNRRVVLVILANGRSRHQSNTPVPENLAITLDKP